MVTLIRTLKRITPAPPPNNKSSETKTATLTAQTAHNTSASHVHHGQIKETETTSDAIEMNKKESDSSAVTLRLSSTSSQKPFATADTSDVKSAAADPDERNTETKFDRKRKASTDEKLPTKKADVNKYRNRKICSANGCTNMVVQGGVCVRHGARVKRQLCSREECTNVVVQGGVCTRHGARVKRKLCSREECTNQAVQGGVCVRHGAKGKRKRCSSEGCTNQAIKGAVCMRHGAKVKLCSREECTSYAKKGGVCMRHRANPWDAALT